MIHAPPIPPTPAPELALSFKLDEVSPGIMRYVLIVAGVAAFQIDIPTEPAEKMFAACHAKCVEKRRRIQLPPILVGR